MAKERKSENEREQKPKSEFSLLRGLSPQAKKTARTKNERKSSSELELDQARPLKKNRKATEEDVVVVVDDKDRNEKGKSDDDASEENEMTLEEYKEAEEIAKSLRETFQLGVSVSAGGINVFGGGAGAAPVAATKRTNESTIEMKRERKEREGEEHNMDVDIDEETKLDFENAEIRGVCDGTTPDGRQCLIQLEVRDKKSGVWHSMRCIALPVDSDSENE